MEELVIRAQIAALTDAALCGDWKGSSVPSVLRAMGRDSVKALDIPAAMEMIALLQHFGAKLPVRVASLGDDAVIDMQGGVVWDKTGKLVLMIPVETGALDHTAHWIADALPSPQLRALEGVLALPFTVEQRGEGDDAEAVLFPEWFAVYYPYRRADYAFPILALRSILHHGEFGGDWVNVAVGRMAHYSLPREVAEQFISHGTRYR